MITVEPKSDVLIVGGGAAGLYAAVAAAQTSPECRVTLITAEELGSGGCSKKTHGINAAMNSGDSWEKHARDTWEGGGKLGRGDLVKVLCESVPTRLRELESWGVRFEKEGQEYEMGTYGGSSASRSVHWYDITGLEIVQELVKRVIIAGCFVKESRWAVQLAVEGNRCGGVFAFDRSTGKIEFYPASAVVLATGGGACVYPISSISSDKLCAGILMGYEAGSQLVDMEMVQFHPTGVLLPGSTGNGSLLEEEMRSQGGILLNALGQRYMHDYDPRGELATRDVVARSTYLEIIAGRGTANGGVIFDIRKIDKETLRRRLPKTLKRLRSFGVDLAEVQQVEISPTAHFLMGGVVVNSDCQTAISGLFACGEDAGGIHGANRLGGNGVAEALVFGREAGRSAAAHAASEDTPSNAPKSARVQFYDLSDVELAALDAEVKQIMWRNVGVVRSTDGVGQASNALEDMKARLRSRTGERALIAGGQNGNGFEALIPRIIARNKLVMASIIGAAAKTRKNSIGAHYLTDEDPRQVAICNTLVRKGLQEDCEVTMSMA